MCLNRKRKMKERWILNSRFKKANGGHEFHTTETSARLGLCLGQVLNRRADSSAFETLSIMSLPESESVVPDPREPENDDTTPFAAADTLAQECSDIIKRLQPAKFKAPMFKATAKKKSGAKLNNIHELLGKLKPVDVGSATDTLAHECSEVKKPKVGSISTKAKSKKIKSKKVESKKVKSKKVMKKKDMTMSMILRYNRFANVPKPEKKVKKAKSLKKTAEGEVKNSDSFLDIRDYPVFPNETFKERFRDVDAFQEFYLPRLAIVNPQLPLFALRYLCKVKHRDIFKLG